MYIPIGCRARTRTPGKPGKEVRGRGMAPTHPDRVSYLAWRRFSHATCSIVTDTVGTHCGKGAGERAEQPSGPDSGRPWHVLRPGAAQYRRLRRPRPAGPRETIAASSPCPAMRETRSSYSSHAFPIPSVLHLSHFLTRRSRNQTRVGEQIFVVLSKTPRTRVRPGMGSQGGGIHAGAGQPSARHVARNRSARSRMRAT